MENEKKLEVLAEVMNKIVENDLVGIISDNLIAYSYVESGCSEDYVINLLEMFAKIREEYEESQAPKPKILTL